MNRYIKAMEIALAKEEKGINYFNLVEQVQSSLDFKFGEKAELTFLVWFIENFSKSDIKISKKQINDYRLYQKLLSGKNLTPGDTVRAKAAKRFLSFNYWLDGNAAKQYLDYLELHESRLASQQARKQSNYSIWIAIGAILISSILGYYTIKTAPQPPYDVKVIEDKTRTNDLEKENKELKEELFKAEMMVKVLEKEGQK